jgi:hypothetical protein
METAMEPAEDETSYSISIRLRHTTVEHAYMNVSVEDGIIVPDGQGTGRIDVAKMTERAVGMGHRFEVARSQEEPRIEPHPIQKAPEASEQRSPF